MRILFTGASSFTGYWFVRALARRGHRVDAIFQKSPEEYGAIRKERVQQLLPYCTPHIATFGDGKWFELLREPFDLFCHHAAETTDYKSPDFHCVRALSSNTRNLPFTLQKLQEKGCQRLLLTGSVFEPQEGEVAMSPYALSKFLTRRYVEYFAHAQKMLLQRFVIPNPFGPYEEERFTHYLMKSWLQGKTPSIATPRYVRDNIHVELLAEAYADSAERGTPLLQPSCYIETQREFALRFASEMHKRLSLSTPLVFEEQKSFAEPLLLINKDPVGLCQESACWDHLAQYYTSRQL